VDVKPLVTHEYAIDDAAAAYKTILDPASGSVAVLLRYETARSVDRPGPFTPRTRVEVAPRAHGSGDLRVALVGAGNLARWVHLPILQKSRGLQLRAICSTSGARGLSYAKRFGAAYCCADLDEVLHDRDVDVVFILTRNQHHASQAVKALEAGKHVFVEKPMALTADECRLLEHTVRETGRQLTVGFNRRFSPYYLEQKQQLRGRSVPVVVNCRVNSPGISGAYWMADPAIGGAILGEACHFVDLMRWLLDSEPLVVSAYSLPANRKEPVGTNNLVASFRFADGSIGSLTYTTVGSRTSAGERVEVFAQGAGAWTENFRTVVVQKAVQRTRRKIWGDKGYAAQLNGFFDDIRQGRTPPVTVRDGARATVGCLRMLESARELRPCEIDVDPLSE
jgi:predicted dehydrogenase